MCHRKQIYHLKCDGISRDFLFCYLIFTDFMYTSQQTSRENAIDILIQLYYRNLRYSFNIKHLNIRIPRLNIFCHNYICNPILIIKMQLYKIQISYNSIFIGCKHNPILFIKIDARVRTCMRRNSQTLNLEVRFYQTSRQLTKTLFRD